MWEYTRQRKLQAEGKQRADTYIQLFVLPGIPASLLTLPVQTAISIAGVCLFEGSGRAASQLWCTHSYSAMKFQREKSLKNNVFLS